MNIVIVEDERRARSSLVKYIQKIDPGYRVVAEAENGYEGIKMIREYEPDVVITDITMPKIDGLNMIEQLKDMNLRPIFIIVTGHAEFEYAQKGIKLGVTDYLLKPIAVDNLEDVLEKVHSKSKDFTKSKELKYSTVINDMVQTIQRDYGKKIGLDIFSEKYKLTPEYLSTIFTQETKQTFSSYLKTVRIDEAKRLLLSSNLRVYEIACQVGYPDQKYFSKVFKEYTGVTAKQYSASARKNN